MHISIILWVLFLSLISATSAHSKDLVIRCETPREWIEIRVDRNRAEAATYHSWTLAKNVPSQPDSHGEGIFNVKGKESCAKRIFELTGPESKKYRFEEMDPCDPPDDELPGAKTLGNLYAYQGKKLLYKDWCIARSNSTIEKCLKFSKAQLKPGKKAGNNKWRQFGRLRVDLETQRPLSQCGCKTDAIQVVVLTAKEEFVSKVPVRVEGFKAHWAGTIAYYLSNPIKVGNLRTRFFCVE